MIRRAISSVADSPWSVAGAAIAWSWLFLGLAAARDGAWTGSAAGVALFIAGGAGPLVAAVALAGRRRGERRALLARTIDVRRVAPRWWGAVVLAAVLPAGVAVLAAGAGPDAGVAGLGGIAAFALVAGLVEEPAWRGLMLDRMRAHASGPLVPGLAIGVAWAVWHLPLYLVEGTFQHENGLGSEAFWAYTLALLPESVLLAWVVLGSGGAIGTAVALHALVNVLGESLDLGTGAQWARVVATAALAAVVAAAWSRRGRGAVRSPSAT